MGIFYNNVQGLLHSTDLKSNTPCLNMAKVCKIQNYIFRDNPHIVHFVDLANCRLG